MIIFDLDGTLWDSGQRVAESWNLAIEADGRLNRCVTEKDIQSVMGLTMDQIADVIFAELPVPERYELARRCEKVENEYLAVHGGRLYPGVREVIRSLYEEGRRLAIVSNCQEGYIDAFLESMGMREYFCDTEEWGRTLMCKADNIRLVMERNGAGEAVYVGDIQADADSAAAAGIPCVWARYGFGSIKEPAGIIDSFRELPEVLGKLGY